jgi:hypothetical protein
VMNDVVGWLQRTFARAQPALVPHELEVRDSGA